MMKMIINKGSGKWKVKVIRRGNWLIHHVKVIYIYTVYEKHVSSESIYILILYFQWWSTINLFSNHWTIDVIKEVVLPRNLNEAALDKKKREQTLFCQKKKNIRKKKMDLILPIIFTIALINGSCSRIIDSSSYSKIVSKFFSCNTEKTIEFR